MRMNVNQPASFLIVPIIIPHTGQLFGRGEKSFFKSQTIKNLGKTLRMFPAYQQIEIVVSAG